MIKLVIHTTTQLLLKIGKCNQPFSNVAKINIKQNGHEEQAREQKQKGRGQRKPSNYLLPTWHQRIDRLAEFTELDWQFRWRGKDSLPFVGIPFGGGWCSRFPWGGRRVRCCGTSFRGVRVAFRLWRICRQVSRMANISSRKGSTYCTSVYIMALGTMSIIVRLTMLK